MVFKIGDKGTLFFGADKRVELFFRAIGSFLVRLWVWLLIFFS